MRLQTTAPLILAVLSAMPSRAPAAADPAGLRASQAPAPGEPAPGSSGAVLDVPPPDPNDPARERIIRLQEQLAGIVEGPVLGGVRVGMRVIDASSGRTFFRSGGMTLMDPASNQKVLVTTAALMRLGAGFRFRTELLGAAPDAAGVVKGDVVLRGMGDPSLRLVDLESLATALATRGVLRIEGGIAADTRRIGSSETHPEERTPLRVHRTFLDIRVRPSLDGLPPLVSIKPDTDAVVVRNRAVTGGRGRRLTLNLTATADKITIDLAGRLSASHPGVLMRRIAPDQRLFTASLLQRVLTESGIEVRDRARVLDSRELKSPGPSEALAVHRSEPLSVIVRRINKESDNEWADRLLDVVGAEVFGGPATADKGLRTLREAMDELGLARESYLPTNGSGLGHGNRLTADALAELLHKIYLDPRWGPEMMQSLSVGGVDGTTRNRFRGSPAAERVRTKTGTLSGKSCISGYVGDGEDVLAFSIFVDGIRDRRFTTMAVRSAQVSAVNAMMAYARGVDHPARPGGGAGGGLRGRRRGRRGRCRGRCRRRGHGGDDRGSGRGGHGGQGHRDPHPGSPRPGPARAAPAREPPLGRPPPAHRAGGGDPPRRADRPPPARPLVLRRSLSAPPTCAG